MFREQCLYIPVSISPILVEYSSSKSSRIFFIHTVPYYQQRIPSFKLNQHVFSWQHRSCRPDYRRQELVPFLSKVWLHCRSLFRGSWPSHADICASRRRRAEWWFPFDCLLCQRGYELRQAFHGMCTPKYYSNGSSTNSSP